ncbi:ComEC family competence protein [Flavimaricola marinus]|uniref:ComEC family competence protein n=1 Tax=Flavimaricola marinus TaxID=1819565 RepID=A0A238LGE2_9RHOB|nr:ComEC family competence protein [Flavimaricola marinus]
MRLTALFIETSLNQRGHLFGWVPVFLGLGIGAYFALPVEPVALDFAVIAVIAAAALASIRPLGAVLGPVAVAVVLTCAGFGLTAARSHAVAAPILGFRYYGPIEGRIVEIDRSSSDAIRLTLDQVRLDRMSPERTPARVRVSLHGDQGWINPVPGLRVMTTGHLSPPNGPVEPGDFDFRRMAWFSGLGGVGYTRNPVLALAPASEGRAGLAVDRMRTVLSRALQERVDGDAGGYAAAVMTGDRSGLSQEANDNMRASNLYHLVSISGMHMGMLAAFVFAVVRTGVALIPPLALRFSAKKIAALVALPAAAFYLALAGRDVPTERAFVMVAVMLVAVLLDRQALTLRSVAIAALIVLGFRPESLTNPGFQMSFAAVVALIFAFSRMPHPSGDRPLWKRASLPVLMLLFSSLVAGTATAPYAAAHFNRIAHYGLIANLLAVPPMGSLVMPGGVILAVLGPIGLEQPALWMIDYGSRWILFVADQVASTDGAMSAVPKPPDAVLPLMTLGLLFIVLWQGWSRLAGLVPVAVALWLWIGAERPALLIADSGALVGLMTAEGRVLSKARGDSFAAENWLENDGVMISQERASSIAGLDREGRVTRLALGGVQVVQVSGKTALAALGGCGGADVLISNVAVEQDLPCDVYDMIRLRDTGALSASVQDGALRITTVRDASGARLWHGASDSPGVLGWLFGDILAPEAPETQ